MLVGVVGGGSTYIADIFSCGFAEAAMVFSTRRTSTHSMSREKKLKSDRESPGSILYYHIGHIVVIDYTDGRGLSLFLSAVGVDALSCGMGFVCGVVVVLVLLGALVEGKRRGSDPIVQIPAEMSAYRTNAHPMIARELIYTEDTEGKGTKKRPSKQAKPRTRQKTKSAAKVSSDRATLKTKMSTKRSIAASDDDDDDDDGAAEIDWTEVAKLVEQPEQAEAPSTKEQTTLEKHSEEERSKKEHDTDTRQPQVFPNLQDPVKIRRNFHINSAEALVIWSVCNVPWVVVLSVVLLIQ